MTGPRAIGIHPVEGIGEASRGDARDARPGAMAQAGRRRTTRDILVVTSRILSGAEGRSLCLSSVIPVGEARRLAGITGCPLVRRIRSAVSGRPPPG